MNTGRTVTGQLLMLLLMGALPALAHEGHDHGEAIGSAAAGRTADWSFLGGLGSPDALPVIGLIALIAAVIFVLVRMLDRLRDI